MNFDPIIAFRRHLHTHPELSFQERATAAYISGQLAALGIEHRPIAKTGILACIRGTRTAADDRRAVVLRADIDALPITERTGLPYASQTQGVMHACGHDMHAAVLFGVLRDIKASPDFAGTLFGLFQPGEELNPGGASKVLEENPFEGYDIRAVLGEHVEPQLEVGTLGFRAGKYMAASDELRFRVRGTGGHAALRDQLKDPVAAGTELVTKLLGFNEPEQVLSIGRFEAKGATNVIPDEVCMEGTLRTFDEEDRRATHELIEELAAETDARYGTQTEVEIGQGYPSVVNDSALAALAEAEAAAAGLKAEQLPLRTTAEDFGHYTRRYPSLFYRLGVGAATGRPHTATFAPDERALEVGVRFMRRLALKILTNDETDKRTTLDQEEREKTEK